MLIVNIAELLLYSEKLISRKQNVLCPGLEDEK